MDRICGAVLNRIHSLSPAGRYLVIDEDELLEAFPDEAEKTFDELKRVLTTLCKGGFIDVKYSSGNMYCIAPLKKYVEPTVIIDDGKQCATKEFTDRKNDKKNLAFLAAFAGGALGSMIVCLIFSLINYA